MQKICFLLSDCILKLSVHLIMFYLFLMILGNPATKKCSYCKSSLDTDEELSSHQQKCTDKPIKCPECSDVIALKNWYDHKCQMKGAEGI